MTAVARGARRIELSHWAGVAAGLAVVALAARRAESPLHFVLLAGFSLVLVALATIDATTLLLPNRLTYPGIAAAVLVSGLWPDRSAWAALGGGGAGFGLMLVVFL